MPDTIKQIYEQFCAEFEQIFHPDGSCCDDAKFVAWVNSENAKWILKTSLAASKICADTTYTREDCKMVYNKLRPFLKKFNRWDCKIVGPKI